MFPGYPERFLLLTVPCQLVALSTVQLFQQPWAHALSLQRANWFPVNNSQLLTASRLAGLWSSPRHCQFCSNSRNALGWKAVASSVVNNIKLPLTQVLNNLLTVLFKKITLHELNLNFTILQVEDNRRRYRTTSRQCVSPTHVDPFQLYHKLKASSAS